MSALSHIKVLDLSRVLAGPWASQLLADLGAEVIKVERPEVGDDTRSWGPPFLKNEFGQDTSESAYYLCTNRGKKSVCIDMKSVEGQETIRQLADQCDVVLENFKVGGAASFGIDYETLAARNSSLVSRVNSAVSANSSSNSSVGSFSCAFSRSEKVSKIV